LAGFAQGFGRARFDFRIFKQLHIGGGACFSIMVRTPQFFIENELETSIMQ
jgi:hypothetical protein